MWRGHCNSFANDQAASVADMRAALELEPEHFEARFFLAKFIALKSPAEAASHYAVLRQRFPENVDVQLWQAENFHNLGKLDEARQIVDTLLPQHGDVVPLLLLRGRIALDLQQGADAERWLGRALELAPRDVPVNLAMIAALQMTGKTAQASRLQERLAEIEAELRRQQAERLEQRKAASGK